MAHPGFIVEFNNPNLYGRQFRAHLHGLGLKARRLTHKTTWVLSYDGQFSRFKTLQRRISTAMTQNGSALIVSLKTKKAWVMTKAPFGGFKLRSVKGW
jgi:hypothetical protein